MSPGLRSIQRRGSILVCRELLLATCLMAGAALGLLALLRSLPETVLWGMLDLREWAIESSPLPADAASLEQLQVAAAGQRPFDLMLELPRPPERGDRVTASRRVPVRGRGPYCLRLYLYHQRVEESLPHRAAFAAVVSGGGKSSSEILLELHEHPVEVLLENLEPHEGTLELRVELRSLVSRPRDSWRRASRTRVQFADLWRCPGEAS